MRRVAAFAQTQTIRLPRRTGGIWTFSVESATSYVTAVEVVLRRWALAFRAGLLSEVPSDAP